MRVGREAGHDWNAEGGMEVEVVRIERVRESLRLRLEVEVGG